jgi:hypothetical protein
MENFHLLFLLVNMLTEELTMYQNIIKYVVKQAHVCFHVVSFVQGKMHQGVLTYKQWAGHSSAICKQ